MSNKHHSIDLQKRYICIWLHGLGANGQDMAGIAHALSLPTEVWQHIFLDAPLRPVTINQGMMMPAWYDIVEDQFNQQEDKAGIEASRQLIEITLNQLIQKGFSWHQLILAGFSQGAAMALYTALKQPQQLGGVMALSGYLPLAAEIQPALNKKTPFFIGYGRFDQVVNPMLSQMTSTWLEQKGYTHLTLKTYSCEHQVCSEEILHCAQWMMQTMSPSTQVLS